MSKRELEGSALTIVLSPALSSGGRFEARLDGDDRVLCISRTPFFDAARELVADGYDPNLTLIVRHAGSDADSLSGLLRTAASLSVEETNYGPKLRRWKPFSTLAVEPRIASEDLTAITPSTAPRRAQRDELSPGGKRDADLLHHGFRQRHGGDRGTRDAFGRRDRGVQMAY